MATDAQECTTGDEKQAHAGFESKAYVISFGRCLHQAFGRQTELE